MAGFRNLLPILALLLTISAQALEPLTPELADKIDPDESNLWFEAERMEKTLQDNGRTLNSPELQAYLQQVQNLLYPEWQGRLRVKIIDDPIYNAFAMPNGTIFIHSGLLARLENEAQLATILAHETGHVIYRHGYQLRNSADGLAVISGVAMIINPLAGIMGIFAQSAGVYGFSRDNEREADQAAFVRIKRAGYDTRETVRTFNLLAEEAQASKDDKAPPYLFTTHPRLEERIDSFNRLLEAAPLTNKELGTTRFDQATRELRQTQLQRDLQSGRYTQLIIALSKPENRARYGAEADYALGEAYRLRKQEGDLALSKASYGNALIAKPGHSGAMRGLATIAYRDGQLEDAQKLVELILQSPGITESEAGFARQLQKKISSKRNADTTTSTTSATPKEELK